MMGRLCYLSRRGTPKAAAVSIALVSFSIGGALAQCQRTVPDANFVQTSKQPTCPAGSSYANPGAYNIQGYYNYPNGLQIQYCGTSTTANCGGQVRNVVPATGQCVFDSAGGEIDCPPDIAPTAEGFQAQPGDSLIEISTTYYDGEFKNNVCDNGSADVQETANTEVECNCSAEPNGYCNTTSCTSCTSNNCQSCNTQGANGYCTSTCTIVGQVCNGGTCACPGCQDAQGPNTTTLSIDRTEKR
jgi:hypothetical protein